MIEPSQARYRSALAMTRLATALGIQLRPEEEDCVCLERLALQAERVARMAGSDAIRAAYAAGYGSDDASRNEQVE